MRVAHFDCFGGVAGDMVLGALLDAGCPLETLAGVVERLSLPGVRLTAEKTRRHSLAATLAHVAVDPDSQTAHRHLPQITAIIDKAALPPRVAANAKAVFGSLARAEADVHGSSVNEVHFHEVGAADAIVDIVCACAGLDQLGVERVTCSPIPLGSGTVTCDHGVMPVPAPATAQLLRGVPIAASDEISELTTPTGAALMTTLADQFGPLPEMTISGIGCGAGTREGKTRPNILRVFVGDTAGSDDADVDSVVVLETQLDDATGQTLARAAERLLEAGALDAYITPIIMKKGRPGQLLTALCRPRDADTLENVVFAETGAFGLRRRAARRTKLQRGFDTVETRFGKIRVKVGQHGGKVLRAWPEYDDCVAASTRTGTPLHDVQQEALRIWTQLHGDTGRD